MPFAGRLADLLDELVPPESWIEPPQMLQTCHRGLWADNVLPTSDGGVCIIDWENSGSADPSQELGCVLLEFACADLPRHRHTHGPSASERSDHCRQPRLRGFRAPPSNAHPYASFDAGQIDPKESMCPYDPSTVSRGALRPHR